MLIENPRKFLRRFLFWYAIILVVQVLAGYVTMRYSERWYDTLELPLYTPPRFLFPIVWSLLYFLMALSVSLLDHGKKVLNAYFLFVSQLLLNGTFSFVFFGLQRPEFGLINLVLLNIVLLATIVVFYKNRPVAALLLIPYQAWILFALYLNYGIVLLNP